MAFVDMGNCIAATLKTTVEKKEHKKFRGGKRVKDRTDIVEVGATLEIKLDEISAPNCKILGLAASITTTTAGLLKFSGLTNTSVTGKLRITGDNDRGPKITWTGNVSFTPAGDFGFIGDDYNVITLNCDVEKNDDDEGFGVWLLDGALASPNAENYQIPTGVVEFEAAA